MPALLQQLKLLVLQRPGRISKALDSGIHTASPEQVQQCQGVLVMAVSVLAEVGVKPQGWGRGKSWELSY